MTPEELRKIKKVVLIDSTWSQTRYYLRQPCMQKLKTIKIQTEKTVFWRYQKGEADTSLSTIEALYFFFRDYETTLNCKKDYEIYYKNGGIWDNLMYFYAHNFQVIQECYKSGKAKDQPFRRIPGYVKYGENDQSTQKEQDARTGEWVDDEVNQLYSEETKKKIEKKERKRLNKENEIQKKLLQKSQDHKAAVE